MMNEPWFVQSGKIVQMVPHLFLVYSYSSLPHERPLGVHKVQPIFNMILSVQPAASLWFC